MAKVPKKSIEPNTVLVRALADILDDADLAELEYETDDVAIRLSRVAGATPVATVAPVAVPAPAALSAAPVVSAADLSGHPHPGKETLGFKRADVS